MKQPLDRVEVLVHHCEVQEGVLVFRVSHRRAIQVNVSCTADDGLLYFNQIAPCTTRPVELELLPS